MFVTNDEDLSTAVRQMRSVGTDLAKREVKTATGDFPKNISESISAFANMCGRSMVLGTSEKGGFVPAEDIDVKTLQAKLAQDRITRS